MGWKKGKFNVGNRKGAVSWSIKDDGG